jgi:hypothetical protein
MREMNCYGIGHSLCAHVCIKSKSNTQEFARQMKQEEESGTADARQGRSM